ncbi:hypothetical protein IC582_019203 [Cucumis melo]
MLDLDFKGVQTTVQQFVSLNLGVLVQLGATHGCQGILGLKEAMTGDPRT